MKGAYTHLVYRDTRPSTRTGGVRAPRGSHVPKGESGPGRSGADRSSGVVVALVLVLVLVLDSPLGICGESKIEHEREHEHEL